MTTKNSRILCILIIAGIPFLIAGLFVYRHPFPALEPVPGGPVHLARDVFLGASIPTALGAITAMLLIHAPLSSIVRREAAHQHSPRALSLTATASLPVLWAAIVVTEVVVRSRYFALWDTYFLDFPLMSTSSILIGVIASGVVLLLGIHPRMYHQAA